MNRIDQLFAEKKDILSVYFTAGYPNLEDTIPMIKALSDAGVDLLEVGIPFSDPLADGPVIQASGTQAIQNGMTLHKLFDQLKELRSATQMPIVLMGYLNPVMQFGFDSFCQKAVEVGVDGFILPDLPLMDYIEEYKSKVEGYGLKNICLITPQTSDERIRLIDEHTGGFIYMVSSASITGSQLNTGAQTEYFNRVNGLGLKNPRMMGFGIHDAETFANACNYASGAIIGSAFIRSLEKGFSPVKVDEFIKRIKPD